MLSIVIICCCSVGLIKTRQSILERYVKTRISTELSYTIDYFYKNLYKVIGYLKIDQVQSNLESRAQF